MHRHPLRQALRLPQAALKRLVTGLLQLVLLANRPSRLARSGFVLPTTVMLVLMVVLTATALTYRSFTRSDMAISQREQQVISNAATPAIDRAKAKIEFLFRTDNRFPSGVPASDVLADLMLVRSGPNAFAGNTGRVSPLAGANDPYTLPDETRVDINNDTNTILDNAWMYRADINGDGTVGNDEIVVYSILVDDEATVPGSTTVKKIDSLVDRGKARALVTRTGPLATTEASPACAGALAEAGWQVVTQGNNSTLQKNFQVNAFVANANAANRTFETLEFQQSRIASRANRWGAWFRYDLGISPGAAFNWNGAMHTDGSLFADNSNYRAHMISSPSSCLYTKEASTITVGEVDLNGDEVADPRFERTVDGQVQKEFQGQIVRGSLPQNVYEEIGSDGKPVTEPEIHYWDGPGEPPVMGAKLTAKVGETTTHSVDSGGAPFEIAMNPLRLFTNDVTEHINPGTWARNGNWNNVDFRKSDRTLNEIVARPFVDDFFRADNRWGPKPRYDTRDANLDVTTSGNTATIGDPITSATVQSKLTNPEDGLDGYWERQAVRRGLRMIVGQRLELGNANGWGKNPSTNTTTPATEALYPAPQKPAAAALAGATEKFGGNHEYLQRTSLRDNLSAVQGMVVYHYEKDNGNFPAACMAMTAHPGTPQSIVNSRTFGNYQTTSRLRTDFFIGQGTNGWEFKFPAAFDTEGEFATAIGSGESLGIALRNLAYFAGDPKGGAPSFKPVQDVAGTGAEVHPLPYMSMWGDFSPLRRIFNDYLDNSVTYANLSPADKATLHSAACTIGMLAYNLDSEIAEYKALYGSTFNSTLTSITTRIGTLMQTIIDYMSSPTASLQGQDNAAILATLTSRGLHQAGWLAKCPTYTPATFEASQGTTACGVANYFASYTRADWVAMIPYGPGTIDVATAVQVLDDVATRVNRLSRFIRDRDLGFRKGLAVNDVTFTQTKRVDWSPVTGLTAQIGPQSNSNTYRFKVACDPNIFRDVGPAGTGGDSNVAIAGLIACSDRVDESVRYPSLYYLFPTVAHDHDGTGFHAQPGNTSTGETNLPVGQAAEDYITNAYIKTENSNGTNIYKVVGTDPVEGLSAIALVPGAKDLSNWVLPKTGSLALLTTGNIEANPFRINLPNGTAGANVALLDKGIFDGREQLNTRVLDIDIEAITKNKFGTGDFWLPANKEKQAEGIVYAFREDAVREDEIVRPKASSTTTAATCSSFASGKFKVEDDDNCLMKFNGLASAQDPPLTPDLISLKPVDFIADPQRRAHGFRLRTASGNPADFSGGNSATGRQVGMTFVTDNSVYIQGDFNPHSKDGSVNANQLLEEFTETLNDKTIADAFDFTKANSFYKRTTLNLTQFANLAVDHWRPVEILADSLTILSKNFKDGSVIDTFTKAEPGSVGGADSSYMNQNRPRSGYPTLANLIRENPSDPNSPVWIDRNGTYYIKDGTNKPFYEVYTSTAGTPAGGNDWMQFKTAEETRRVNTQPAAKTYVNALFVSGIVPQRPKQTYGGLHNYPRLLESWRNQDLFISGAFIQLNFSTSATGPYEQDAWEANTEPQNALNIGYYAAPGRRWGYDVGLLYVPPAPAARRFVSIGAPRSEYYRELPADDPYIVNLRCAKINNTTNVFTNEGVRGSCAT